MKSQPTIRFGIVGTARIATKVTQAINATSGAEVVAVASRSESRAREWAAEHAVPRAFGSYRQLIDDEQVDAVYVPLPPNLHAEWTIRAAEAGKHVLCEKPIAMNAAEAEEMAAACREHQVQLMDATMWVHHPRTAEMFRHIEDGTLGQLRRVTAAFGFMIESYLQHKPSYLARDPETGEATLHSAIRHELRFQRAMGGGALLDTGWYCVRVALWAFGGQLPRQVFATARYRNDVDINLSGLMWYDDDRVASFDCGYDLAVRKWFEVTGTDGSVVCDDFLNPWQPQQPRYWLHRSPGEAETCTSPGQIQEQLMIENLCRIIRGGELDPHWPAVSIANQRICDALDQSARTGTVVDVA